jgi:MHS family proline/betaine transporter-like MFS transporter
VIPDARAVRADRAHIAAVARALEINTLSMTLLAPLVIDAGALSDRLGRKPLLLLACGLGFIGAVPLFLLLNQHSASLALLGQLGFVLIMGLYGGIPPVVLAEAAPVPVRCTAVSLGYNIAFGLIGGLTPLMAAWLVDRTGDEIAPAFLIMLSAAITFETYRAPFPLGTPKPAAAYS